MRPLRAFAPPTLTCILALASLVWAAASLPQTTTTTAPTLTAEQLRLLQGLTPEQRAAVSEAMLKATRAPGVPSAPVESVPPSTAEELDAMRRLGEAEPELPSDELFEGIPRLEPLSSLLVELIPRFELGERFQTDPETGVVSLDGKPLGERLARLVGRNVFQLDRYGVLSMEGAYRMPLAGLTAEEAAARIGAEPDLRIFDVKVTLLPLEPTGGKALELFGRELFNDVPTTFAPATDIPVPPDYVIGPGDTIRVQLFGNDNRELELPVTRDGLVLVPGIGPFPVAGLTFDELRAIVEKRVSEQMIGVRTSVTLGTLRSVRVYVMGDASRPGSYAVSGLSTMANALFASGGILPNGSLRNVALMRGGKTIGRLDLYDALLRGDTSADLRIQSGDVIFVPPIGRTVGVEGEVARPAIYELRNEKNAGEVVELAGGLLPQALARSAHIERIEGGTRTAVDVDLASAAGRATPVVNGDIVHVPPIVEGNLYAVSLTGHVANPRDYQWRAGLRLTDVISSLDVLQPDADLHYVLVRRELPPDRFIEAHSADLTSAFAEPGSEADLILAPRDRIIVFDKKSDRGPMLAPLLGELARQARQGQPVPEVDVGGRVNNPGRYPMEPGMRVSDLLRAGGMLHEAAYTLEAELTRYSVVPDSYRETELIQINLQSVLAGDATADVLLQPHDYLIVKEVPQWGEQESVEILGEVLFPGIYPIHRNETIGSVLRRAGGLTDIAFAEGSVFIREDLKAREAEQIEELATRLESDLVSFSLQSAQQDVDAAQVLTLGQTLLSQLRATEPTGRLVVDISRILRTDDKDDYDIIAKNDDKLFVPRVTQEITVLGEVQNSTSHLYQAGLSRDDYIARSGGVTAQADSKFIYVVHANGEVVSEQRSAWFKRSSATMMRPGDTIVVPLDADRVAPLVRWTSISQIIYQLALAAASANAVGVF